MLAQRNADGTLSYNYKGLTGASVNAEIAFGRLFGFMNRMSLSRTIRLQPYLFGDAGTININPPGTANVMSSLMADAGAGITLNVIRWGPLYNVKPLTVRFDVPFFVSRLPFAEEYIQFRWMIGVNRAF